MKSREKSPTKTGELEEKIAELEQKLSKLNREIRPVNKKTVERVSTSDLETQISDLEMKLSTLGPVSEQGTLKGTMRREELSDFADLIEGGTKMLSGLSGMEGIKKSDRYTGEIDRDFVILMLKIFGKFPPPRSREEQDEFMYLMKASENDKVKILASPPAERLEIALMMVNEVVKDPKVVIYHDFYVSALKEFENFVKLHNLKNVIE